MQFLKVFFRSPLSWFSSETTMPSSSVKKKITLKSSDGVSFDVDEAVAKHMMMIGDDCAADSEITLPNVKSKILAKVIEYCKKHAESSKHEDRAADNSAAGEELKAWDAEFVRLDPLTLLDLLKAARHLKMGGLTDLTTKAVAELFKGKTAEQVCETFNMPDPELIRQIAEEILKERLGKKFEIIEAFKNGKTVEELIADQKSRGVKVGGRPIR